MNKIPTEEDRIYPIPCVIRSSMTKTFSALVIFVFFGCAFYAVCAALFLSFPSPENILFPSFFGALDFIFLVAWSHTALLKKGFLKISEEKITLHTWYGTKEVYWKDLNSVSTVSTRGGRQLHLMGENEGKTKTRMIIPSGLFGKADFDRLVETIAYLIYHKGNRPLLSDDEQKTQPDENTERKDTRGNGIALFRAFLLSSALLVVNTFVAILFPIHPGYLEIPITFFAARYLLTVYRRKAQPGPVPLSHRILLGLFVSFPLVTVPLFTAVSGFPNIDLLAVIAAAPVKYVPYAIAALLLFLCGCSWESVRRYLRTIHGGLLKKRNGFSLQTQGNSCTIYLTDYAELDPDLSYTTFNLAPGYFFAEKIGKIPTCIYLPETFFLENSLNPAPLSLMTIEGRNFYSLNLGENGEPAYYYQSCRIYFGEENRIEVIQLIKDDT